MVDFWTSDLLKKSQLDLPSAWIFFLYLLLCMNFFWVLSSPPHHFSNGPSLKNVCVGGYEGIEEKWIINVPYVKVNWDWTTIQGTILRTVWGPRCVIRDLQFIILIWDRRRLPGSCPRRTRRSNLNQRGISLLFPTRKDRSISNTDLTKLQRQRERLKHIVPSI